jgi:hypothetical protein
MLPFHLEPRSGGSVFTNNYEKCDVCAVIIAPDYGKAIPGQVDNDTRAKIHQYLIDAGVLPKPLKAAQDHASNLREALMNAGVDVCMLTDDANLKKVTTTIQHQAQMCRKLFIYFCGHGHPLQVAPTGTVHGVLDLVGADKLLTEHIVEKLKSAPFGSEKERALLVYAVNACCAGMPPLSPANAAPCESQSSSNRPAYFDMITIPSVQWGYSQSQDEGAVFGRKIIDIINQRPHLPIKQWEGFLQGTEINCPKILHNMPLFQRS